MVEQFERSEGTQACLRAPRKARKLSTTTRTRPDNADIISRTFRIYGRAKCTSSFFDRRNRRRRRSSVEMRGPAPGRWLRSVSASVANEKWGREEDRSNFSVGHMLFDMVVFTFTLWARKKSSSYHLPRPQASLRPSHLLKPYVYTLVCQEI